MNRRSACLAVVGLGIAAVLSAEEGEDDQSEREIKLRFEKNIKPLLAGVAAANRVAVYGGLPDSMFASELFEKEKQKYANFQVEGFFFYATPTPLDGDQTKKLAALCSLPASYSATYEPKLCGGFHPDWCLEFNGGTDLVRILACFGCHEAQIYGRQNNAYADLPEKAYEELVTILKPLKPAKAAK